MNCVQKLEPLINNNMKITERIYWNYDSPDGCIDDFFEPELDKDTRQREEDEVMEDEQ
jgi:hypothetical protein